MSHKNDLSFIAKLNGKEKFSLRKLSVGLVTVALGTTFFLESSNTTHAAEVNTTNQNITSQENISESTKSSTLNIQKNNTSEDNKNDVKALPTQEQTSASQTNKNSETNNQELNVLAAKSETQNNKATQANILEEKVQATNETQATAVTITGAEPNKSMMANVTQGSIKVHVNTDENKPITINNGQKVTVSISDTNNLLRFGNIPSKWNYFVLTASQTNTDKTFTFTYTGNDDGVLPMSLERRNLLKALGAQIVLTDGLGGMAASIAKAQELRDSIPGSVILQQFENPSNAAVHERTTGEEIWRDTDGEVAVFVAGVGTGGTICGVACALKKHNPDVHIVAVEPASSPILAGGQAASHRIQGIGANFIPKLYDASVVDEVIGVPDDEAIRAGRELAATEGLLAGISSGAAVYAARQLAQRPEFRNKKIVALLPDTGERYLSTELFAFDAYPLD